MRHGQRVLKHSQSNFSCDIHKVGIINFCIGICVVKGIEGFCGNPRQKCWYKNRMECTDSNVSVDKTSKNKVSAVGAEKVVKWCKD